MQETQTGAAIHIALTFDDSFWAPAFGLMRSICLHTHRRTDLVFHLCHRPLTEEHRADLLKIEDEFGATLKFYDLSENAEFLELVANAPYHKRMTNIVYARLLLDRFLPKDVKRLIYLDCDMMVMAPIEKLAELDLEGKSVAAVEEPSALNISNRRDAKENRDLIDPADPYFNAGLVVIDMEKWHAARIPERLAAYIADGTMDRIYYDQDLLNIVFCNDAYLLDQRWNLIGPRPEHQAFNPFILHYTGERKPWNLVSGVAFARTYRHVMTNELFYRYWRFRMKKRLAKYLPFIKVR
ncbi:glycosyltransferase family 8 protein [Pelagibacterium xiamenense]|uniref:glycosyltransferase family 8 protein n=1 Tax=Pelagibacterium xiamenense TaxID=2901140 RepID=UPI001E2F829B|nr:glycosyltransferase family 8 protein [Pelagibacterium xiamenense]MCD7058743.1 glycosyltransferase family 8 protein [Pelagibacterium xiamenense]